MLHLASLGVVHLPFDRPNRGDNLSWVAWICAGTGSCVRPMYTLDFHTWLCSWSWARSYCPSLTLLASLFPSWHQWSFGSRWMSPWGHQRMRRSAPHTSSRGWCWRTCCWLCRFVPDRAMYVSTLSSSRNSRLESSLAPHRWRRMAKCNCPSSIL